MDDEARDSQNTILIQDGASDLISNEQKKNKKKKIIIIVVVVSAVVAIALALTLYFLLRPAPIPIDEKYYYDPNEQIKNYIVNKTIIKLGIISDFQLNDKKNNYERNLKKTLEKMKSENVDAILMAGDIVDTGYQEEYDKYKSILNSVYTDSNTKPYIFEIMGNHEYYTTKKRKIGYDLEKNIKIFRENFDKYPFYHTKINQFHFIFWSMQNYDNKFEYKIHTDWIEKHIKLAEDDLKNKGDPIFIITHAPAKFTVYGSEEESGTSQAFDIFKKYENVFVISGHSHRSLRHERSIWQQEFTAINTQSIAYAALSYNYTNSSDIVDKSADSYMGFIANLYEEKIEIKRYYFHVDTQMEPWIVPFPLKKENFNYTVDQRKMDFGVPYIWNNNIELTKTSNGYQVKFYHAFHNLAIHSYIFKYIDTSNNNKEIQIYGDYYLHDYKVNNTEPKYFTVSDIDINKQYSLTAIDFFQNEAKY